GTLTRVFNAAVALTVEDNAVKFGPTPGSADGWAQAGTARALVNNMIKGTTVGFEKKLTLVGVGYRAKASGNKIDLQLGFSHPVSHVLPEGVTGETPSQTEIILKGVDNQAVNQVAAEIRAYRPPEPYKGKGVRYSDEVVRRKEAKKK
ncbi:MAG: 50S ribosomal protein L6, partial [Psychrobium sp.]|nr:50S ribosomal protein L6 [Psychrobium sp.]